MIIKSYLSSVFKLLVSVITWLQVGPHVPWSLGGLKKQLCNWKKNVTNSDFISNLYLEKPQKDRGNTPLIYAKLSSTSYLPIPRGLWRKEWSSSFSLLQSWFLTPKITSNTNKQKLSYTQWVQPLPSLLYFLYPLSVSSLDLHLIPSSCILLIYF